MAEYYLDTNFYIASSSEGTLSGTIDVTNGSTTITGTGTLFTTELQVGDYIDPGQNGIWYKVTGITDDVTLTINAAYQGTTATGQPYKISRGSGTPFTLTGTVNFTAGSTTVTGTGTLFTSELIKNAYIRPVGKNTFYKIVGITDDLTLTIDRAAEETYSGNAEGLKPFCHLAQYTTDTVRSPGDILYCQAGQTLQTTFTISCDEDGSTSNPITIRVRDFAGTGTTDTKLHLNAVTSGIQAIVASYDKCWVFEDLEAINYYRNYGIFVAAVSPKTIFRRCGVVNSSYIPNDQFRAFSFSYGVYELEDCYTIDVNGRCIHADTGSLVICRGYTAEAPNTKPYCVFSMIGGQIVASNSNLQGITTIYKAHSNYSFCGGRTLFLNNTIGETLPTTLTSSGGSIMGIVCSDTLNATYSESMVASEDADTLFTTGNIAIKYISAMGGELAASSICEWQIEVPSGTYTVQVLVKTSGLTAFPTADQLYLEVEYLDDPSSYHVNWARSTEAVTANDTETTLSVTFTQARDGKVRIRVHCGFDTVNNGGGAIYVENGFTII